MTARNVVEVEGVGMERHEALSADHLKMLREESGISEAIITARGYRTVTDVKALIALGFTSRQLRQPGLLLPLHATDGSEPFCVYRPNEPRIGRDGKPIKYEIPKNSGVRLDCPPMCRSLLDNPSIPLWITEGQKKADSLASRGVAVVDMLGVDCFKGKNPFGGVTLLADWDYVALDGRDIRIVFDNDVMRKPEVRKALERLTEHLQRKRAHVSAVYLPIEDGRKIGVDDYLAAGHTLSDLEALIEGPRPQPQPAQAIVELLDEAPLTMRRPLALMNGRAYAAFWPHVKTTATEALDKNGAVVKLNPPREATAQRLLIVRDDGRIFGDGGDDPLESLGLDVHLLEIPQAEKLWSTPGVKTYRAGARPNPADVFTRLVATVDRFIDFDRSLADQRTMCEMVACYILATWFLDAFTVIGFLWPNGDRGSGKTQLLLVVTELAYLGQTILAGGSYASLRDLADYGACLAFDDAENLSDPRRSDPDKRTLLLAGNRRGNTVPVKEPGPDRTWKTRHVNTFCPRLFSAIRLPDDVLASRAVVVPLIRTPDRYRANADPLDYKLWPHDRRALTNDLWALSLSHLPELSSYEAKVNDSAALTGRMLEPWRALLAIAKWLDENGVSGLWKRMDALSLDYQKERIDFESSDLTKLVILALVKLTISSISSVSSVGSVHSGGSKKCWTLETKGITEAAKTVVAEEELDIDPERVTGRRIGRVLGRLRFEKDPNTKKRAWLIKETDLARLLVSFGFVSSPHADPSVANATNATNAGNATDDLSNSTDESALSEVRTSENGSELNGHDEAEAETSETESGAGTHPFNGTTAHQPCPHCHKPDCVLSPWGWLCRLSDEDRNRWDARQTFADDSEADRMAAEERRAIQEEEKGKWEADL